jgi:hypothetical protein
MATVAVAGVALSSGCAVLRPADGPLDLGAPEAIADPPRRPGTPLVLVAMPGAASFQATRRALVAEIGKSFDVATLAVSGDTSLAHFGAALEKAAPACVVLMNNSTVRLYRDYQRAHPGAKFPPAVIVMTSFLEDIRHELAGVTGIAYEVPGVTAFVSLRAIVEVPVTRVGVLHSRYSRGFVERQRALAAKEQIALIPVEVSAEQPTLWDVRNALRALRSVHHVDALWVLNDNRLLRDGRFLIDAWTPALESLGLPVVVGAAPLVNPQAPFGTFAMLPDHAALGIQTANLILDLADDDWRIDRHPVELPLSTISVLDVEQARARFGLRPDALNRVDKPID